MFQEKSIEVAQSLCAKDLCLALQTLKSLIIPQDNFLHQSINMYTPTMQYNKKNSPSWKGTNTDR